MAQPDFDKIKRIHLAAITLAIQGGELHRTILREVGAAGLEKLCDQNDIPEEVCYAAIEVYSEYLSQRDCLPGDEEQVLLAVGNSAEYQRYLAAIIKGVEEAAIREHERHLGRPLSPSEIQIVTKAGEQ